MYNDNGKPNWTFIADSHSFGRPSNFPDSSLNSTWTFLVTSITSILDPLLLLFVDWSFEGDFGVIVEVNDSDKDDDDEEVCCNFSSFLLL